MQQVSSGVLQPQLEAAQFCHGPSSHTFAKKITAYCKKAYKVDIKAYANSRGVLFWIVDYKDYADYDKVRSKIASDKRYWQIVSTAKNLFIEGSLCDEIITPID